MHVTFDLNELDGGHTCWHEGANSANRVNKLLFYTEKGF